LQARVQGGGWAGIRQGTGAGQVPGRSVQRLLCDNIFVMDMDFATIRRTTIIALFADDELAGMLALKGGNALSLVHGITSRTSVDLDFSITQDFQIFPTPRNGYSAF